MRVWFGWLGWVAVGVAALACDDKPKSPDQNSMETSGERSSDGRREHSRFAGRAEEGERNGATTGTQAEPSASQAAVAGSGRAALSLRLATWNVVWLNASEGVGPVPRRSEDYARLARYAARLNADVVALQEVDGPEAAARIFDSRRYAFHFTEGSGAQRTGFAVKRALVFTPHDDFAELNLGHLRSAADITVHLQATAKREAAPLRLLSVHLKSGCFDGPPSDGTKARRNGSCDKLFQQLPALESWIDARASEGTPFAVLGDFNRRLFARPDDPFWSELDDADPPPADLDSPTRGQLSRCWGQRHPHFIDHLVFGKAAHAWLRPSSFAQLVYDVGDQRFQKVLSDHCALSVELSPTQAELDALSRVMPIAQEAVTVRTDAESNDTAGLIKGNVGRGGAKLYHHPGCPNYDRVQIDAAKGERVFESEAEARAAGWTKSSDCK